MSEVDAGVPAPESVVGDTVQDAPEDSSTSPVETPPEPPKVAKGVQKRLDELTALRREAIDREQRAVREAEFLRQQLLQFQQQQQKPAEAQPAQTEPQLAEFEDYAAYTRAVAKWEIRQEMQLLQQQQVQAQAQQAETRRNAEFQSRVAKFATTVPDFQETVVTDAVSISKPMLDAIQRFDAGPEVMYYLGKNREEAARIAQIPDNVSAAIEIGRLAAIVSQQPKRATNAPAPVEPLAGGDAAVTDDMRLSTDEWIRKRNRDLWEKKLRK